MSYLETLQQHNASLQSLINKANSLPEAGSGSGGGSGGSVETCTVTITTDGTGTWRAYAATVLSDDGAITYSESHTHQMSADTLTGPITIQNCVCGSIIYVNYSAVMPNAITNDLIMVYNSAGTYIIQAPTTAGASATITLYDDD